MEKTHYFDEIFFYLSKAVIIIPIVVVIIALIIKFSRKQPSVESQKILSPSPTVFVAKDLNLNNFIIKDATGGARLNFGGPFYCEYSLTGATLKAHLKNSSAQVELKRTDINNLILKDDCIYFWETGGLTGQKICSISSYLPMLQLFTQLNSSGGLLNISSLLSQFGGKNAEIFKNIDFKKLADSCKKQEINEKIFEVPANVLFKNENPTKMPRL